jgi:hypothetical protein
LFPVISWCIRFFLPWSYAAAIKRERCGFLRHHAVLATIVTATVASSVGIAAAVQVPEAGQRLAWNPSGTYVWWITPGIGALICWFGFPRLAALHPVMRSYRVTGLGDRLAADSRLINASLALPVIGLVVSAVVGGLVYHSRNVDGEAPIVRAAYVLDHANLVLYYGISAPLVYCTLIITLVLHRQQARTLHQLIQERSSDIRGELDSRTPLSKRLLLQAAPKGLQGSRPLRAVAHAASGVFPSISPSGRAMIVNPLGAGNRLSTTAQPSNRSHCSSPRRPASPITRLLSQRADAEATTRGRKPRPNRINVDQVILLHDAVRRSVQYTACFWQVPLSIGFCVGIGACVWAVINVINGTTGIVTPLWYAWLASGPLLALFFLGPVVWYNSVWPSLMGLSMNWSRWTPTERTYLLPVLSAPDNKLAFPIFGFDMSGRDLLNVLGPMVVAAAASQIWSMRDRVIHPQ